MEKFYSYFDIIFLVFIIIFLLFIFIRLLGKRIGLQRSDVEVNKISNPIEANKILKTAEKFNPAQESIEVFATGSLNYKLNKIKESDSEFDLRKFIVGSKKAFELIVTNFNNGNLNEIEPFLTKEVFEGFSKYSQQKTENHNQVSIEDFLITDVIDAEIKEDTANIKVKFLTKQKINNQLKEINEIWTFNKNIKENSSIWKLSGVSYG